MAKRFLLLPILAIVATLMLVDPQKAQAQRRGGGFYAGPGYWGGGYYGWPGYYSYYGDGIMRGYGDGYGYWRGNYGYSPVYWRNGYWDNTGYWRDGMTGGYWYTSDGGSSYVDDGGYQVGYSPSASYGSGSGCSSGGYTSSANPQARIFVRLESPDAKVWLDDQATKQSGLNRMFDTPPLQPGVYTYHVRAKWKMNGRDMDETRVVHFRPGEALTVDFTQYTVNNHTTGTNNNNNQDKKTDSQKKKSQQKQQPD